MPSPFFGNDLVGMSFEAVFGFHVNKHGNHSFCIKIVALGVTRGCLLIRGIPRFHGSLEPVHQTWTLFFCLLSTITFNQTFIVYKKYTSTIQKGPMLFPRFWDSPWKKSYVEKSVASIPDQRDTKSRIRGIVCTNSIHYYYCESSHKMSFCSIQAHTVGRAYGKNAVLRI